MWSKKAFLCLLVVLTFNPSAFACRVEGMMGPKNPSPAILREEARFLQTSLVDDQNSLQKESAKRPAKQGTQDVYDYEDLVVGMRERGNMDGWGLVCYDYIPDAKEATKAPNVFKNAAPAYADKQYDKAVQQSLGNLPRIMLAHIRRASAEYNQVNLTNVHPFTYQNWSFMHNGGLTGSLTPAAKAKIEQYHVQLGDAPKGTTDSEHAFYYFLSNLYESTGTTDSKKVSTKDLEAVFAKSVSQLVAYSERKFMKLDGHALGVVGTIEVQPSCNFVISDGTRLLAYKRGMNLFLGKKTLSNGQHLYLISSEKTHSSDKKVEWLAIPENHIVSLAWDESGNPVPTLHPLAQLAP